MKLLGLNRVELLVNNPDQAERDLSALLGGEDGLSFEREPAEGVLDCRVDWKAGIEIVHPESDEHVVGQLLKGKPARCALALRLSRSGIEAAPSG